jgi:hypothetical protein
MDRSNSTHAPCALTRTAAKAIARQNRRGGYFRTATTIYQFCPRCGRKVEDVFWPSACSLTSQLDGSLVEHLLDSEQCCA